MTVVVFERVTVCAKGYIGSGVPGPLCRLGYADTVLKLQADRCVSELMWVYPWQVIFLCEIIQPVSRCAGAHKISRVMYREKYSLCKVIPLVTV